jgi:hypothetical protein
MSMSSMSNIINGAMTITRAKVDGMRWNSMENGL